MSDQKAARIYLRVSTHQQDLARQEAVIAQAKAAGCYVAGVYREKASGARTDRPELQRMIADLQQGDVVMAEKMDRISRLPLPEAEALIQTIRDKGATLCVPDVVDLSEMLCGSTGVTAVVLNAVQDMLLKLALQMARDDYETRRRRQEEGIAKAKEEGKYKGRGADGKKHKQIITLRTDGRSIAETADISGTSTATVKRVWREHNKAKTAQHSS